MTDNDTSHSFVLKMALRNIKNPMAPGVLRFKDAEP
jgi:hypothetical protein